MRQLTLLNLFSTITGDLVVVKKFKDKFNISERKKLKMVITTNSVIGEIGTSFKARQHGIALRAVSNCEIGEI